jgi:hypothetical protein
MNGHSALRFPAIPHRAPAVFTCCEGSDAEGGGQGKVNAAGARIRCIAGRAKTVMLHEPVSRLAWSDSMPGGARVSIVAEWKRDRRPAVCFVG